MLHSVVPKHAAISCRVGDKEEEGWFGGHKERHWYTHEQFYSGGKLEQGGG